MAHQTHSSDMQACIETCQSCHTTCLHTLSQHCLELGGKHVEPKHFRLMLDCAQICAVSADFMIRGSAQHAHICKACATICEACASDCERVGDMDDCVAACRACAESCRKMSQMA